MNPIRKFFIDWKYWTMLIPIVIFLTRVWALPPRVEANEEDIKTADTAVQSLSSEVKTLVAVHKEQMQANEKDQSRQDKQLEMLTELHLKKVVNGD